MNRIRLASTGLLAALTTVAALSGCTTQSATPVESAPAGDNRPAATETVDSAAANEPADEPAVEEVVDDGVAAFGEAYTWSDGLSVTISAPESYSPSDYAAGVVDGQSAVTLQITLVNGTGAAFDPVMTSVTAQSGNTEASQIFDSAQGLEGSPMTKILPGRETTYKVAFSVADPADLVVEFAPDWEHDSVLFVS